MKKKHNHNIDTSTTKSFTIIDRYDPESQYWHSSTHIKLHNYREKGVRMNDNIDTLVHAESTRDIVRNDPEWQYLHSTTQRKHHCYR